MKPLLARLSDPAARVRESAVIALAGIGEPAVRDLMDVFLSDTDEAVRSAAARSLGMIRGPAVPALISALDNTDAFVSETASATLAEIGTTGRGAAHRSVDE